MLACLVAWILWQPYYRPFGVFAHFEWPRPADIAALVRLGTPIGVSLFMEGSRFAVVSLVLGRHFGAEVVAGHQIALNVASVTFMVPLGIAIAITVRVGQAKGAGDLRGARRAGFVGGAMALAFMSLAALTLATVPELIAAIYTNDREVRSIAVSLLTMAALFQIFDGLQVAGAGALRGLKDTAVPMGITCVSYWVVGFTVGYTLGIVQGRGAQAMWLGLTLGLVVAAVLLNTRFYLLMRRMIRAKDELQFTRDAGSS
jgi:MATE family multidrug resistance protein